MHVAYISRGGGGCSCTPLSLVNKFSGSIASNASHSLYNETWPTCTCNWQAASKAFSSLTESADPVKVLTAAQVISHTGARGGHTLWGVISVKMWCCENGCIFGFVMYDSHFWNHVSEKCLAFEL